MRSFVSEVRPTGAEWFKAIEFLTAIGHKCDDKRQEFILASDVMGVSMLVDDINNRRVAGATPSTVEGPFHIAGHPKSPMAATWRKGAPGIPCFMELCAASTASRSLAPCSTCSRLTAKGSTKSSAAPRSRGCAASIIRRPTAPTRSAPSHRSVTRSRWTARSARSLAAPT